MLQYSARKNAIFSALNFIVLDLIYHALTSAYSSYEEKIASATEPDQLQLYSRAFSLRPNRVLFVLAIFKMIDEKMLALRLRTSAT